VAPGCCLSSRFSYTVHVTNLWHLSSFGDIQMGNIQVQGQQPGGVVVCAKGPMVFLGGGAVFNERGTPGLRGGRFISVRSVGMRGKMRKRGIRTERMMSIQ
jgi:hypothetical protein